VSCVVWKDGFEWFTKVMLFGSVREVALILYLPTLPHVHVFLGISVYIVAQCVSRHIAFKTFVRLIAVTISDESREFVKRILL
jgi:hypothetical protein